MEHFTDEEWADLVAHELPKTSDPVIQHYLENRRALIAQEQKDRSDSSFRRGLSPIAREACEIVSRIRREDSRSPAAAAPADSSRLRQILKRMPKGALLRAHCHALVDVDYLVTAALDRPGMCISCPVGSLAGQHARREADFGIHFRDKADPDCCSIWAADYKAGTFVTLSKAANEYPEGGRPGFMEWLKGRCRTSMQDCHLGRGGVGSTAGRGIIGGMIYYEPIWRTFLQRVMTNMVEDGVYWLEMGLTFPLAYYREGSEAPERNYDRMFQAIDEEVAKFQSTNPGRQFWGLRVVWSTLRSQESRTIVNDADNCISTKLLWPQLVAGYDLAGLENLGRPLADLLPELFWFRKQCAQEDVQIPFCLTAGASPGDDGDVATERNLFDALLLGTRRIGNALALPQHPRLIEAVRDRRVLVEICPSLPAGASRLHPLWVLLAHGVPCALCDDDSGILFGQGRDGASRMTNIFLRALLAGDMADLATLGSLAENSVRWAAFEDQDAETWRREVRAASVGAGIRSARLQQWAVEWERFCLWIVTEYGDGNN
ncbi:Metallo-dependent hydrolase [Thermothelomyces heterothallicus CBS 203.75]